MAWQPPEGMDEYLKPTKLCDCDNDVLRTRAKEIIKDAETPKDAALKIFSFVRDGVLYMMSPLDTKASRTLKKGNGVGVNKTNVQVALLRAVGIPARYHHFNVKTEWHKGIVSGFMCNRIPDIAWWPAWCECYLGEKWVACHSLFDKALFEAMLKKGLVTREQIPTIDWDGDNDLILLKHWITEDKGIFPSLDDVFRKAQKETQRPVVLAKLFGWFVRSLSNRHTDKIRKF